GVLRGERLAGCGIRGHHAAFEHARTHSRERDLVTVGTVHTGLHLEHERRERCVQRTLGTVDVDSWLWLRCQFHQQVEQVTDAEIVHRGAEQQRRGGGGCETLSVELAVRFRQQVRFLLRTSEVCAFFRFGGSSVQVLFGSDRRPAAGAVVAYEGSVRDVQHAAEDSWYTDRRGDRHRL